MLILVILIEFIIIWFGGEIYIESKKNIQVKELYSKLNFDIIEENQDKILYKTKG